MIVMGFSSMPMTIGQDSAPIHLPELKQLVNGVTVKLLDLGAAVADQALYGRSFRPYFCREGFGAR